MTTPLKVGGFVATLAAVFALAIGIGRVAGPTDAAAQPAHAERSSGKTAGMNHGADGMSRDGGGAAPTIASLPGGLMVSDSGYTFDLAEPALSAGRSTPVSFRVLGPDGEPVTDYTQTHDKELHFIAVRRDLSGFQHLHPTKGANGQWSTTVDLSPGTWRFFADFAPAKVGRPITLGVDAAVPGTFTPSPLPHPSRASTVGDYAVTLDGALVPGQSSKLTLTVAKGGNPVTDLQPYLAAYGHLVALRAGDLAYLHVHPDGEPGDGRTKAGPQITFHAEVPSTGDYRLFLDFKHDGMVHTAEFTQSATGTPSAGDATTPAPSVDSTSPSPSSSGHADHSH
ncbi:hypothetical protein [Knoellia koreensis]|uniref:Secreted protein n=1 Tax=Knoellia koreensis TaxID=2730921 RepID=A0A849HD42_9MICO|nr:hypothetical protein [Knoellia sp. DB2414S]NNM47810.1 hypothetical protein [Knoellia sp. DB2414S]